MTELIPMNELSYRAAHNIADDLFISAGTTLMTLAENSSLLVFEVMETSSRLLKKLGEMEEEDAEKKLLETQHAMAAIAKLHRMYKISLDKLIEEFHSTCRDAIRKEMERITDVENGGYRIVE